MGRGRPSSPTSRTPIMVALSSRAETQEMWPQASARLSRYQSRSERRQMTGAFGTTSFGGFLAAVAIAAVLATLIFRHADRRGNQHATAWGVFTFLAAGVA